MHLTGGQYKGRYISTPKGYENPVKPTLSKVRESVFNILNSCFLASLESMDDTGVADGVFSNLSFLDMFAGSGIMALEAHSRGFKNVCAIEKQPKVFSAIKKMYAEIDVKTGAGIKLFMGDSVKIAPKLGFFDVIYIDPPWDFDYTPIVECALKCLKKEGIIITECNKKGAKQIYRYNGIEILPFKEKIYGRCKLDFIKLPS